MRGARQNSFNTVMHVHALLKKHNIEMSNSNGASFPAPLFALIYNAYLSIKVPHYHSGAPF